MGFRVLAAGTHSLLVDSGRPRTRSLGVPVGGAADRAAYILGNALVGNRPDTASLELTLAGPTLEATGEHACAVAGAAFRVQLNDRHIAPWHTFNVHAGDRLIIATCETGLRGYLSVRGGIQAPVILGSRSAFSPIAVGMELDCPPGGIRPRWPGAELVDAWSGSAPEVELRVLPGTHLAQFDRSAFAAQVYTALPESNRMGVRLAAQPLARRETAELLSSPLCPGTIQVTNDGQAIVLGVDAQTIGGYPRVAQVIAADLDRLAQVRPGGRLRFQWVEPAAAQEAISQRRQWLMEWQARLAATAGA